MLPQTHPSFGTKRALFTFALGQGPIRVLTVEATNEWAVLCMESLLQVDGKVSDNCQVLQVIRDYRSVGTRSELVSEVPFADFMTDLVDPHRMTGDVVALEAFKNALTDEEAQVVKAKLGCAPMAPPALPPHVDFEGEPFPGLHAVPEAAPVVVGDDQSDRLVSALVGLGFKKTEVREVVASLGSMVQTEDLHALIRESLRQLAA
jgi:hypothetical protein